jgi:crotonobetainyl-CoA:carnitine CoA-transferase CaiB-like acyl-CoA transferase
VASKIAQASGIMGGSLFTVLDVMGGVVAAQGITVALLAGLLHRFGMKVDTSLLGSATLLCADELSALRDGINPIQSRRDRKRRFIKGVYPTKKGLIAIECGDEHATFRLSRAIGVGVSIDDCRFKDRMSDALLGKSADDWIDIFKIDDLPAAIVVEDLRDLEKDERIRCCLDRRRYTQVNSPWRFQ